MKSRRWIFAAAAAAALTTAPARADDVVTVGLILPMTGQSATTGKQEQAGANLYIQMHGDTVAVRVDIEIGPRLLLLAGGRRLSGHRQDQADGVDVVGPAGDVVSVARPAAAKVNWCDFMDNPPECGDCGFADSPDKCYPDVERPPTGRRPKYSPECFADGTEPIVPVRASPSRWRRGRPAEPRPAQGPCCAWVDEKALERGAKAARSAANGAGAHAPRPGKSRTGGSPGKGGAPWVWKLSMDLVAPGLALAALGLAPLDRPPSGASRARARFGDLNPVAAGLPDVEEKGLLHGVLVRAGLDMDAALKKMYRRAQDVLAAVEREGDVMEAPLHAVGLARIGEIVALVGAGEPHPRLDTVVEHDPLGQAEAEDRLKELAIGGDVGG